MARIPVKFWSEKWRGVRPAQSGGWERKSKRPPGREVWIPGPVAFLLEESGG